MESAFDVQQSLEEELIQEEEQIRIQAMYGTSESGAEEKTAIIGGIEGEVSTIYRDDGSFWYAVIPGAPTHCFHSCVWIGSVES